MKVSCIIIIFLIFFVQACKKEKQVPIEIVTSYVDTNLMAEFFFCQDSYWVYENQLSDSDSIFVFGIEQGMIDIPCPHGCPGGKASRYEYYNMALNSYFQTGTFNLYFMFDFIRMNGGGEWGQNGQPVFV